MSIRMSLPLGSAPATFLLIAPLRFKALVVLLTLNLQNVWFSDNFSTINSYQAPKAHQLASKPADQHSLPRLHPPPLRVMVPIDRPTAPQYPFLRPVLASHV